MSKNLVGQENNVVSQSAESGQNAESTQTGGKSLWEKVKGLLGTGQQSALLLFP